MSQAKDMQKIVRMKYTLHHFVMQNTERMYLALQTLVHHWDQPTHPAFVAAHHDYQLAALEVHGARLGLEETWGLDANHVPALKPEQFMLPLWATMQREDGTPQDFWTEWIAACETIPVRTNVVLNMISRHHAIATHKQLMICEACLAQGAYVLTHVPITHKLPTDNKRYIELLNHTGPKLLHALGMDTIQGLPIAARPFRYDVEEFVQAMTNEQQALDAFLDRFINPSAE